MHRSARRVYRIVVRSELSGGYAEAFKAIEMEAKSGLTVLAGEIIDQPHLYGILERISSLGLELLSVQSISEGAQNDAANPAPITEEGG